MDNKQPTFQALATLFERYVRNLGVCQGDQERACLLLDMVILIKEVDRLVVDEYLLLAKAMQENPAKIQKLAAS